MLYFMIRMLCVPLAALAVSAAPATAANPVSAIPNGLSNLVRMQDGGVRYFSTQSAAERFARDKRSQGFYTKILRTQGGQYRVEWWGKHASIALQLTAHEEENLSLRESAEVKYVLWYRKGNGRYNGIRGLSYDHACRLRDDYVKAGYNCYIEKEKSK